MVSRRKEPTADQRVAGFHLTAFSVLERRILRLIVEGKSDGEIDAIFRRRSVDVRQTIAALCKRFGVTSRADLVKEARFVGFGRYGRETLTHAQADAIERALFRARRDPASLPRADDITVPNPLTPYEGRVIAMLAKGATTTEIVRALFRNQNRYPPIANLRQKLGLAPSTESAVRGRHDDIVEAAYRLGFIVDGKLAPRVPLRSMAGFEACGRYWHFDEETRAISRLLARQPDISIERLAHEVGCKRSTIDSYFRRFHRAFGIKVRREELVAILRDAGLI